MGKVFFIILLFTCQLNFAAFFPSGNCALFLQSFGHINERYVRLIGSVFDDVGMSNRLGDLTEADLIRWTKGLEANRAGEQAAVVVDLRERLTNSTSGRYVNHALNAFRTALLQTRSFAERWNGRNGLSLAQKQARNRNEIVVALQTLEKEFNPTKYDLTLITTPFGMWNIQSAVTELWRGCLSSNNVVLIDRIHYYEFVLSVKTKAQRERLIPLINELETAIGGPME